MDSELKRFFDKYPNSKRLIEDTMFNDMSYFVSEDMFENFYILSDDDMEQNADIFDSVVNLTVDDVFEGLDAEEFSGLTDLFEGYDNNVDESEETDAEFDYQQLTEQLYNEILSERHEDLEKILEESRKKFIVRNGLKPGFNEYGNYVGNENDSYDNSNRPENEDGDYQTAKSIYALEELDDKVGDDVDVDFVVDVGNNFSEGRDLAFIYIDGEILLGESDTTHSNLSNQWLEEHGYDKSFDKFYRPTQVQIDYSELNNVPMAYGSIWNDIAFITPVQGCTAKEVADALEKEYETEKVYQLYDSGIPNATRIANKHCKRLMKKL